MYEEFNEQLLTLIVMLLIIYLIGHYSKYRTFNIIKKKEKTEKEIEFDERLKKMKEDKNKIKY
jgi:hypothetical protein